MSDDALARLRAPDSPHVTALARLVADDLAQRPLVELLPPEVAAREVRRWLEVVATAPDQARARWVGRLDEARLAARSGPHAARTARDLDLPEVEAVLRRALAAPWSPDEALVRRLIDQPAVRSMLGEVLSASLHSFIERVRSLDDGVLGGLGGKAVSKGRGLFGGLAQGLSAATEGVVATVREELQRALEGRVQPFVGQASEDAVGSLAAWVANPAHAPALAELRLALLDAALDTPLAEFVAQADGLASAELVELLVHGAAALTASPTLDARLVALAEAGLGAVGGDGSAGAVLDDLHLHAPWRAAVEEAAARHLTTLIRSHAFGAWWQALHA